MRDLRRDLDRCHEYEKEIELGYHRNNYDIAFAKEARKGWPHAIERAIKAEAEVERLQKVYAITNESWKKQVEENAQLRNVANAAKMVCALCPVSDTCIPDDCWVWPIKVALKEGER